MDEVIKVKDRPDLVRHKGSKAILNVDQTQLNKYKEERERQLKLARVVEDTETLKNDVQEIKQMLMLLLKDKT